MSHRASYRLRPYTYPLGVFNLRILLWAGQRATDNGRALRAIPKDRAPSLVCLLGIVGREHLSSLRLGGLTPNAC
jgi:hypothetical protein